MAQGKNAEEYSHHFSGSKEFASEFYSNCDPNPFYGETKFSIEIQQESEVSLQIFNQMGFMIAEPLASVLPAGNHSIPWDPEEHNLRSGVYYARISSGEKYQLLKIRYIK